MKWFKHDCDMHTDLKIQALIAKHGLEGYAIWNLCLELLGKEGKKGVLNSKSGWQNGLLKVSGWSDNGKLKNILESMAELNLINSKSLKYGNLHIPKFVKRADDYTMRLLRTNYGQSSDNVPLEQNRIDKNRIDEILFAFLKRKAYPTTPEDLAFHYKRYTNVIKRVLIQAKGDAKQVLEAMNWLADICDKKGLTWTLETVEKWLPEYKVKGKASAYDSLRENFGLKKE